MLHRLRPFILASTALGFGLAAVPALAQDATQAQIKQLQAQIQEMQKQLKTLAASQAVQAKEVKAVKTATTTVPTTKNGAVAGDAWLQHVPGKGLSFTTPGGQFSVYGNLDLSLDAATKGYRDDSSADSPVGVKGWQPDISTNSSYIGIKGSQNIPGIAPLKFIYQLETQIDVSATSGTGENNSAQSNVVKDGLTSRNSFIGLSSPDWGAVMVGKTDAPYKNSTQRMNPFSGTWGDYAAIMGNTGGDNRVEFGTRLDHSIWYESPTLASGFQWNFLFSPGQNRASNSDNIAAGESDCTGGNIPGSGQSLPIACNDGSFSNAVSTSLSWTHGGLYVVGAYERHFKVNRQSDIDGEFGGAEATDPTVAALYNDDVKDEDAAKIGAMYTFSNGASLAGIVEYMHRYDSSALDFQNERTRWGTWLMGSTPITKADTLSVGWAHAFRTPGDPGVHNDANYNYTTSVMTYDGVAAGPNAPNQADLITAQVSHDLGGGLSTYFNVSTLINGDAAHYALGAGGRSITDDCHDANNAAGGINATNGEHCWAGSHEIGTEIGMKYKF